MNTAAAMPTIIRGFSLLSGWMHIPHDRFMGVFYAPTMAYNRRHEVFMEFPKQNEKLFTSEADWQLNACIDCYTPTLGMHADYFKDCADALAHVAAEGKVTLDKAIIPIVFLYRHFIELSLKDIICTARQLESEGHDFPQHHRLDDLWTEAKRLIEKHYGKDSPPELANVQPYIDEFMTHDPYATAFRYPTDRDGTPSLRGLKHINLRNLYETMERLGNMFECLCTDLSVRLDWVNEQRAQYSNY